MSLKDYESFIDRTIKKTQSEFSSVIRRILTLVEGATRGGGNEYLDVSVSTEVAQQLINDAGYSVTVTGFLNDSYNSSVNETSKYLKSVLGGSFRFSDESIAILESIRENDLIQFGQIHDDLRTRIGTGFTRWAQGGITRDDLIQGLREQVDIIDNRYLKTQVDTAFSGYNRAVTQKMAEDSGFTKFRYVGPLDNITRKFCQEVLSGVYGEPVKTIEEWNKLNDVGSREGQPKPVSVYQGGYNCRHNLVPVE